MRKVSSFLSSSLLMKMWIGYFPHFVTPGTNRRPIVDFSPPWSYNITRHVKELWRWKFRLRVRKVFGVFKAWAASIASNSSQKKKNYKFAKSYSAVFSARGVLLGCMVGGAVAEPDTKMRLKKRTKESRLTSSTVVRGSGADPPDSSSTRTSSSADTGSCRKSSYCWRATRPAEAR